MILQARSWRGDLLGFLPVACRVEFVADVLGRQLVGVGNVAGHIEHEFGQDNEA